MASTPEQTAPNPEELRAAIASGDPVQAMPALAKLRALARFRERQCCDSTADPGQ